MKPIVMVLASAVAVSSSAPFSIAQQGRAPLPASGAQPMSQADLDALLAPIALYPDALIAQIVQCAGSPYQVKQVADWLDQNADLKGTAAQDAASQQGFDASFVAIVLFPDVVRMMAQKPDWTRQLGDAFRTNQDAVFASIQRLRTQAQSVGNLKSTDQQNVQTVTTSAGQQVIVIEPANPQIVYVPQYNPQVVYTQPVTYTSSVSTGTAVAAGVIGFAAGVIVGAAIDNDNDHYYYGCGGWGYHGPILCSGGWDDYYDHREDMAKDYYKHRENMANDYYDYRKDMAGQRGDNQAQRQDWASQNQGNRQDTRAEGQTARAQTRSDRSADRAANAGTWQAEAQSRSAGAANSNFAAQGNPASSNSGAFTGYQRGSTERASSARGRSSMGATSAGTRASGARAGGGGRRR